MEECPALLIHFPMENTFLNTFILNIDIETSILRPVHAKDDN